MKIDPRMDRHLKAIYPEPHVLFDAGDAVQGLVQHPGWLHVTRLIEWEIATIDATLDEGNTPLSRAEYALLHGRRDGLRAMQRAADAIFDRAQREYRAQRATHERDAESSLNGGPS